MFVNALFLFLMFRCGVDILSPEEKGTVVVALYVVTASGLTAVKIALSGATRGDMVLCAVTFWLLIFNLLYPAALFFRDNLVADHIPVALVEL